MHDATPNSNFEGISHMLLKFYVAVPVPRYDSFACLCDNSYGRVLHLWTSHAVKIVIFVNFFSIKFCKFISCVANCVSDISNIWIYEACKFNLLCKIFCIVVQWKLTHKLRRAIESVGLHWHDSLTCSTSSSDVCVCPGALPFTQFRFP
jgi:hypothetical protein